MSEDSAQDLLEIFVECVEKRETLDGGFITLQSVWSNLNPKSDKHNTFDGELTLRCRDDVFSGLKVGKRYAMFIGPAGSS